MSIEYTCPSCGTTKTFQPYKLKKKIKQNHCGCLNILAGKQNIKYTGYEDISGKLWADIRLKAKNRGIHFDLKIEDAWVKYESQGRLCALSGLPIDFAPTGRRKSECTASLDRIDSKGGYTLDNVQWVDKRVNMAKQSLPEDEFVELCKAVAQHSENRRKHLGFYIERSDGLPHGKANYLVQNHGGRIVDVEQARLAMYNHDVGVVSVKNNGMFEAAGFCFSQREFEAFADPKDYRPTTWVLLDRKTAEHLSNYRR